MFRYFCLILVAQKINYASSQPPYYEQMLAHKAQVMSAFQSPLKDKDLERFLSKSKAQRKVLEIQANPSCKNIKCPPHDDPVCVQMQNSGKDPIFVIMVNRCELGYVNCHPGIQATEVSMEKCEHRKEKRIAKLNGLKSKMAARSKNNNSTNKIRSRLFRQIGDNRKHPFRKRPKRDISDMMVLDSRFNARRVDPMILPPVKPGTTKKPAPKRKPTYKVQANPELKLTDLISETELLELQDGIDKKLELLNKNATTTTGRPTRTTKKGINKDGAKYLRTQRRQLAVPTQPPKTVMPDTPGKLQLKPVITPSAAVKNPIKKSSVKDVYTVIRNPNSSLANRVIKKKDFLKLLDEDGLLKYEDDNTTKTGPKKTEKKPTLTTIKPQGIIVPKKPIQKPGKKFPPKKVLRDGGDYVYGDSMEAAKEAMKDINQDHNPFNGKRGKLKKLSDSNESGPIAKYTFLSARDDDGNVKDVWISKKDYKKLFLMIYGVLDEAAVFNQKLFKKRLLFDAKPPPLQLEDSQQLTPELQEAGLTAVAVEKVSDNKYEAVLCGLDELAKFHNDPNINHLTDLMSDDHIKEFLLANLPSTQNMQKMAMNNKIKSKKKRLSQSGPVNNNADSLTDPNRPVWSSSEPVDSNAGLTDPNRPVWSLSEPVNSNAGLTDPNRPVLPDGGGPEDLTDLSKEYWNTATEADGSRATFPPDTYDPDDAYNDSSDVSIEDTSSDIDGGKPINGADQGPPIDQVPTDQGPSAQELGPPDDVGPYFEEGPSEVQGPTADGRRSKKKHRGAVKKLKIPLVNSKFFIVGFPIEPVSFKQVINVKDQGLGGDESYDQYDHSDDYKPDYDGYKEGNGDHNGGNKRGKEERENREEGPPPPVQKSYLIEEDTLTDLTEQFEKEARQIPEVNMDQYKADCPNTCPARTRMVCARCTDRIFRTFLSSCHLRMFNCKNPDEKVRLVAWRPCTLSAPYLKDQRVPEGRITEIEDDDIVLRYKKCQHDRIIYGKTSDPRCNFQSEYYKFLSQQPNYNSEDSENQPPGPEPDTQGDDSD